jgi:hypothetical protein
MDKQPFVKKDLLNQVWEVHFRNRIWYEDEVWGDALQYANVLSKYRPDPEGFFDDD